MARSVSPRKKRPTTKTAGESPALPALIPQPHGGALYAAGVRGNGGGRPADETRRRFKDILDEGGHNYVRSVVDGEVVYTVNLKEKCEHCGKPPTREGDTDARILKLLPSPDTRLRAVEIAARVSIGDKRPEVPPVVVDGVSFTPCLNEMASVLYDLLPAADADRVIEAQREAIRRWAGSGMAQRRLAGGGE